MASTRKYILLFIIFLISSSQVNADEPDSMYIDIFRNHEGIDISTHTQMFVINNGSDNPRRLIIKNDNEIKLLNAVLFKFIEKNKAIEIGKTIKEKMDSYTVFLDKVENPKTYNLLITSGYTLDEMCSYTFMQYPKNPIFCRWEQL